MLGLNHELNGIYRYMADTKLAQRLAEIIEMLYAGQSLCSNSLAEHFSVSARTIRRDFSERLSFLNIVSTPQGWKLDSALKFGKQNKALLDKFAKISGAAELLPYFDESIIKSLLDIDSSSPYLIKRSEFETQEASLAKQKYIKLEKAILNKSEVSFNYNNKYYPNIAPYKLVHFDGFWYLAGTDNKRLKAFHVAHIKGLGVLNSNFLPEQDIEQEIFNTETIWFGEEKLKVTLKISAEIAQYFVRKKFFPEQEKVNREKDNSLTITTSVVNERQLFPLVMRWIPHIHIIEPAYLQEKLNNQLITYTY